jgi:hypothetical protein
VAIIYTRTALLFNELAVHRRQHLLVFDCQSKVIVTVNKSNLLILVIEVLFCWKQKPNSETVFMNFVFQC